jgi:hypothetical protein
MTTEERYNPKVPKDYEPAKVGDTIMPDWIYWRFKWAELGRKPAVGKTVVPFMNGWYFKPKKQ